MLGGINNGLFLQSFGGFVGLALLILVLKWGFSSNKRLIITPIKAGKKDQYGLLKPLQTPSNYIEAQMSLQKLNDANTLTRIKRANIAATHCDYRIRFLNSFSS